MRRPSPAQLAAIGKIDAECKRLGARCCKRPDGISDRTWGSLYKIGFIQTADRDGDTPLVRVGSHGIGWLRAATKQPEAALWYWLYGVPYCPGCVTSTAPCLSQEEAARATREAAPAEARCHCCGERAYCKWFREALLASGDAQADYSVALVNGSDGSFEVIEQFTAASDA